MWKLAWRNVSRQRIRSLMTVGAIAAGVVSLILAAGFVADIFVQLRESTIHSQLGHIQINRDGFFKFGMQAPSKYVIGEPESLRESVLKNPDVDDAMGRLRFSGLLNSGRSDLAIIGEGVEPSKEERLGTHLTTVSGRVLKDSDGFGIMVGEGVALSQKLQPGDRVTLVINNADGSLNSLDFEVVGVFRSMSKDFDARAVRVSLAAAQELLGSKGINTLVVSLRRTEDTDATAQKLRAALIPKGYEIKTWDELSDFYRNAVDLYDIQFGVLRLIILGMVLLGVANSVNMSVFERYGEFGTMRALGDRNRIVMLLIVTENVIIGIGGALVGLLLGVALALLISAVGIPMPPAPNSSMPYTAYIRLEPLAILNACTVGLIASIAAASYPAFRVSRSDISASLRHNV